MSDSNLNSRGRGGYLALAWFAVAGLLLCLIFPSMAGAKTYEGVGTFGGVLKPGDVSEESQLGGVGALAVNYTGAGEVAKGTVYAVTQEFGNVVHVARFEPKDSGLKFVEKWRVLGPSAEKANEEAALPPYEICGPAVVTESLVGKPECSMSSEASAGGVGVAVDPTTGNVYVTRPSGSISEGEDVIAEYEANGSDLITRFGEKGPPDQPGNTVAKTPDKIHSIVSGNNLAVNAAGEVFFFDFQGSDNFYHRLMVFKPKTPGNYTDYEYAGQGRDIGAGFLGESNYPTLPVVDALGDVYVADEGTVEKYDPSSPDDPVCTFSYPQGGITALAVNPATGEPFFYSYQKRPRRIHELSACENGAFHETGETEVAPERAELSDLAFDPARQLSAGREPGVLYGAAPGATPIVGKGQPGTSALGYIFAQPEERPPVVSTLEPFSVTANSAVLSARIDPRGFATDYVFRYLTQADYQAQGESFAGAAEAPLGGATLSAVGGVRRVEAVVSGLVPDTDYVFQVVASSNCAPAEPTKVCPVESTPASFHTYPTEAAGLPDGRAYELVSPADKQGGQVYPVEPLRSSCSTVCKPGVTSERFPMQSSPDGGSVVYEGDPFGPGGALIENEYLSRRTGSGWGTTNLTPSLLTNRGNGNGYTAFDPALNVGVLRQSGPALTSSTPGEYRNLYAQSTADPGSLTALLTSASAAPTCLPGSEQGSLGVLYMGASTDLSRVFFEANDALTPDSTGICGQSNLYEWAEGALRAVNVPPAASGSIPGAVIGSGTLLKSGNVNDPSAVVTHAISDDGSRIFFTGADGELYVRIDGTTTLEVPGPGNCSKTTPLIARVCFLTASADGSSVLLSDGQVYALNGAGTAYELSAGLAQSKGGFLGIAGQSEDMSQIYFVDTANLTEGEENDQGAIAEAGENNLYAWIGGTTRFVATLSSGDGSNEGGAWTAAPLARTAQASPAGRWLAFQSESPLTGYDNTGPCAEVANAVVEAPCTEVFVYDSQTRTLTCASCNPSGSRALGSASTLGSTGKVVGYLPQPRYLTDSGRLYFDTPDRLVPGDTNGQVEDVYQYESGGVGGCTQDDHCLDLISSGRGSADSNFLAIDETGDNVFFTTRDRLVSADKDELIDLYDARVGGGFPEAQPPAECKGEACQQASGAPPQPAPASMGLPGEGIPRAGGDRHCRKGQVKRKGRCVKKHKKRPAEKRRKNEKRHERKGGNR